MLLEYGFVPIFSKTMLISMWRRKWNLIMSYKWNRRDLKKKKIILEVAQQSESRRVRYTKRVKILKFHKILNKWLNWEDQIWEQESLKRWTL
jgi:Zn-finger domain-containing protein